MSKELPKYVNAPLSILKDYHTNPVEALSYFFNIGIYRFADAINYKLIDVLRSIIFGYNDNNLPDIVKIEIDQIAHYNDVDTNDFDDFMFDINDFLPALQTSFNELDGEVIRSAVMYYKLKQAEKLLGLTSNHQHIINQHKEFSFKNSMFDSKFGKDANVSLTVVMLFDFIKEPKSKYEFDLLAAFIAVKSIQGNKQFCKTNKAFLLMRMLGAKSKQVLADNLKIKSNKVFYDKYSKRYNMDKILDDLVNRGFILSKIGMSRSIYLSTQLSFDLLPIAIAESVNTKLSKVNEKNARECLSELLQQLK